MESKGNGRMFGFYKVIHMRMNKKKKEQYTETHLYEICLVAFQSAKAYV